jgi:hypothetical protein
VRQLHCPRNPGGPKVQKRYRPVSRRFFHSAISGLIPRHKLVCTLAVAQVMQRLQRFGIKPDSIINFRTRSLRGAQTQTPFKLIQRLRYRAANFARLPRGGSLTKGKIFLYSLLLLSDIYDNRRNKDYEKKKSGHRLLVPEKS